MAMMGHSEARMTALYTADDLQRHRTKLDLDGGATGACHAVRPAQIKQKRRREIGRLKPAQ
jgi:hypothetical protein